MLRSVLKKQDGILIVPAAFSRKHGLVQSPSGYSSNSDMLWITASRICLRQTSWATRHILQQLHAGATRHMFLPWAGHLAPQVHHTLHASSEFLLCTPRGEAERNLILQDACVFAWNPSMHRNLIRQWYQWSSWYGSKMVTFSRQGMVRAPSLPEHQVPSISSGIAHWVPFGAVDVNVPDTTIHDRQGIRCNIPGRSGVWQTNRYHNAKNERW